MKEQTMTPVSGRILRCCQEVERARALYAYARENLEQARQQLHRQLARRKAACQGHGRGEDATCHA